MAPLEGLVPGRPSNAQTSCPLHPTPAACERAIYLWTHITPLRSNLEANAYMGFLNRKKPVACAVKTSGKAEGGNKP